MAITVAPPKLPTMEQTRATVLNLMMQNLRSACDFVQAHPDYQNPPLALETPLNPDGYSQEVKVSYDAIPSWPFVCVFSGDYNNVAPFANFPGGQYEGELFVREFIQNSDDIGLILSLDRYMAAIWLVLIDADINRLLPCELVYGTEDFSPDPSGGSLNARAVQVYVRVRFRI